MKELGDAINESLSDSEQISEVVSRIKEGGYDIFLVLEATIGVSKQGEKSPDKTSLVTTLSTNPEFKINDQDLKFLRSLRIKIDEEKHEKDKLEKTSTTKTVNSSGRVFRLGIRPRQSLIQQLAAAALAKAIAARCATIYCFLFALPGGNKDSGFTDTIESESEGSHERYSRGCLGGRGRRAPLSSHS
jgi:hypothetical protein